MKKSRSTKKKNIERNRVERKRQSEIDDEIQMMMCFLPDRVNGIEKLSRQQILEELCKVAEEIVKEEQAQSSSAGVKIDTPSTSAQADTSFTGDNADALSDEVSTDGSSTETKTGDSSAAVEKNTSD